MHNSLKTKRMSYTIGLDFGTDSVRCLVVDVEGGKEVSNAVAPYPRWARGLYCDADRQQYRQHPLDHLEAMESVVKNALKGVDAEEVRGIGVDTTGSSPLPVDSRGIPLAMLKGLEDEPAAMVWLWKDHTAIEQAKRINEEVDPQFLQYVGGIYSSEWFWAKWLQVGLEQPRVRERAISFVEHCDWLPFVLTGGTDVTKLRRSVCAAGHKALWADDWKGLPEHPLLTGVSFNKVYTSDKPAGYLCDEWVQRFGLSNKVIVAIGAFDAHMGAVGGEIEPNFLSRVMGTSTCDILVTKQKLQTVKGICGQVKGSVIPGMIGLEAGQSAFGDAYAWVSRVTGKSIPELSAKAAKLNVTTKTALAVDWFNGRRTPDADQSLKAGFLNLSLATTPAEMFYAVAEATCFGARAIIERMIAEGVEVKGLIGLGGVAKRNPLIMQLLSNVAKMPLMVHKSEQTCALGAAMFASVAAGVYHKVEHAMQKMGQGFETTYLPEENVILEERYRIYQEYARYIEQRNQ